MNKAELVKKVAKCAEVTQAQARRCIDCYHENVGAALRKGDMVTMAGFGQFSVARRKARKGRSPATGMVITIPAKKTVRFKASKKLI